MEQNAQFYYRITAHSSYSGEEISIKVAVSSREELCKIADDFVEDCMGELYCDYIENSYNPSEVEEDDFYSSCYFEAEEITEEEFLYSGGRI